MPSSTQKYELWQSKDGTSQFFCSAANVEILLSIEDNPEDFTKTWEVVADSKDGYIEAMTKYHEHMGWRPYRPMK